MVIDRLWITLGGECWVVRVKFFSSSIFLLIVFFLWSERQQEAEQFWVMYFSKVCKHFQANRHLIKHWTHNKEVKNSEVLVMTPTRTLLCILLIPTRFFFISLYQCALIITTYLWKPIGALVLWQNHSGRLRWRTVMDFKSFFIHRDLLFWITSSDLFFNFYINYKTLRGKLFFAFERT